MTSIIGYTRVPFNSSASKHFSIAPVQQLYQNKPATDRQQLCVVKTDCHDSNVNSSNSSISSNGSNSSSNNNRRPTYHRMFSREMSQHGIIELIIDKKKKQQKEDNNKLAQKDNKEVTTIDTITSTTITPTQRRLSSYQQPHTNNYNILLSIDLSTTHDYDNLSTSMTSNNNSNYDNLQKLMDSISRIAQEKTIHFVHILNLLKKLQLQQEKHRFMSCIDKHSGKILVYFPNTISYTSLDQTYEWLKYTIGVDIDRFKHWQLSTVNNQDIHTTETKTLKEFDGDNYFNDIHLFIDHIDNLIESDGLFSHNKKKRTNNK